MENISENTKSNNPDPEDQLIKSEVELKTEENIKINETNAPVADNAGTIKKKKIGLKTVIIIVLILGILSLAYYFKNLFIVAVVNGTPISRLAVISRAEKASGKNMLDMIITMKLVDDEAKKKGISVTKDEIDVAAKKIEEQFTLQGLTLEQALDQRGVSLEDFRQQMKVQIELEKLLADKVGVSEADIDQYITSNKVTIPEGQESTYREQIKSQLEQQKFSTSAGELIDTLRSAASIYYFLNY